MESGERKLERVVNGEISFAVDVAEKSDGEERRGGANHC
jgi:hypothetical protein